MLFLSALGVCIWNVMSAALPLLRHSCDKCLLAIHKRKADLCWTPEGSVCTLNSETQMLQACPSVLVQGYLGEWSNEVPRMVRDTGKEGHVRSRRL